MSSTALPKLSKRKARADPEVAADGDAVLGDTSYDSDDSSSSDPSFINVDFDFRSPQEVDEPALRRLLRQLFNTHANALELHKVSEKMIALAEKEGTGTVIKVEGDEDQDPFGFVTALPLSTPDAASQLLTSYLSKQLPANSSISPLLSTSSGNRPYVFLHERFINLPAQTAPPLYRILTDEVTASAGDAPPTHVVFFSRVFSQEAYSDDEDEGGAAGGNDDDEDKPRGLKGAKRRKGGAATKKKPTAVDRGEKREWGYFRPEDEILEKHAMHTHTFRFPPPQEAEESYESPLYGRITVLDWSKISTGQLWDEMDRELGGAGLMQQ